MQSKCTPEEINLLQEYINRGMLSLGVVDINAMKKDKVNEIHTFAISKPKDNKSRWSTYVKGENTKRIKITSTTESGLYDKLYHFYYVEHTTTLSTLFPDWIEKRRELGVNPRTVARNVNHWDKYYKGNKIVNIPIQKLDSEQIETFFYGCIKEFKLTVKELGNMKFIMVDMFKLAMKRKIISVNPMINVDVKTVGCKPPKKQSDTSRVYLPEERDKLFQELNRELRLYPNKTDSYAVFLLFKLGLRVGEVVALKWSDIDLDSEELHIHRIESLDANEQGKLVTAIYEHTKKKSISGDRFLPLSNYELGIFRTVREINARNGYAEDDFIFCDEKGRTNIRSIDNLIRKCCKRASIEEKSAHDIRRTVASEMYNNGIPVVTIQTYLGHSDFKTTLGYILDNTNKRQRNKQIFESLDNLNGLCTQTYSFA